MRFAELEESNGQYGGTFGTTKTLSVGLSAWFLLNIILRGGGDCSGIINRGEVALRLTAECWYLGKVCPGKNRQRLSNLF